MVSAGFSANALESCGLPLSQERAFSPVGLLEQACGMTAGAMEGKNLFNAEGLKSRDDLRIFFPRIVLHMESAADGIDLFPEHFDDPFDYPEDPRMSAPRDHRKAISGFHDKRLFIKDATACIRAHLPKGKNIAVYLSSFTDFDK